jgi:glycine/D-amino acid oxidase-like deaminating enzyme
VAICINAFTQKLLPEVDLLPGRGMILITKPIPELKFKGAFHFQEGYYYFRNYENRILFGGGRNLNFEKETSIEFRINENIQSTLHSYLQEIIIPGQAYEVDYQWTGIMAFGKTKAPIIKKVDDKVVAGARLSGMGVAIGTLVGEKLAKLMLD